MKRRRALAATLWLPMGTSPAQVPARPARIGVLGSVPYETWPRRAILVGAMRERGWIEGTHYVVDALVEDGSPEHCAAIAAELMRRNPDLLLASSPFPQLVQAGVLMSYTWSLDDIVRRVPYDTERILKGTPAGDLPVEQPTRFYLTLNLKRARALGMTLPQALLLLVDEEIE